VASFVASEVSSFRGRGNAPTSTVTLPIMGTARSIQREKPIRVDDSEAVGSMQQRSPSEVGRKGEIATRRGDREAHGLAAELTRQFHACSERLQPE
jgi:hypothetical protein